MELKSKGVDELETIWNGELEGAKFSFTKTVSIEDRTSLTNFLTEALLSAGPAAVPLMTAVSSSIFAPWFVYAFEGEDLRLGAGWEFSQAGAHMRTKVVDRCQQSGLSGYLVRFEGGAEPGKVDMVIESCISIRSPLPLSVKLQESNQLKQEAKLEEHRGL